LTRDYLGLAAVDILFAATGLAALLGLGFVGSARAAVRSAGLAFTVGWALYGIAATLALSAGASLARPVALLLCVAVAGAALAARRALPAQRLPAIRPPAPGRTWVGRVFLGLLVGYLGVLCVRSVPGQADTNWDAWAFWLPKAKSIYYFGGLDNGPGGFTHFANRDYPPLGPALDATSFHAMGATVAAPLQFQHWLQVAAFFAAIAVLLGRRVRPELLWPSLAALALMPRFGYYVGSSLADETLAMLTALAGVCAALWLLERRPGDAVLFTAFATAATLLKNEGLVYGLALASVVAAVAVRRGERRTALALVGIPVLALVPWKAWLVSHGLPASSQYYNLSDLAPGHLGDASGRLGTSVTHLGWYLVSPNRWLLVVPLALAAAALGARKRPELALLTGGFVALSMAALVVIYWIGSIPIDFWLLTSGERVVMSIVVCCGALLPLLVTEAVDGLPPTRASPTARVVASAA
jgi:hypothetical protein